MDQKTDNIEISYPNFFLARFARRGLNCAKNSRNSASGVLFLPKIRGIRFRGLNCAKNSKPDDLKNLIKSYQDISACGGLLSDKNHIIYL